MRSRAAPTTLVLVIGGCVGPADVAGVCDRVRALLEASDIDRVVCDVRAMVAPDAAAVDALARVHVIARRLGRRIRLANTRAELEDLVDLMGLGDVLQPCRASDLESIGEAEQREERRGVEEECDARDAPL